MLVGPVAAFHDTNVGFCCVTAGTFRERPKNMPQIQRNVILVALGTTEVSLRRQETGTEQRHRNKKNGGRRRRS